MPRPSPDPRPPPLRRIVFHLGGYDPVDPADQHRRFGRELARFSRTWNVSATASSLEYDPDGAGARWNVETQGPGWATVTSYRILRWDDIVRQDMRRPELERLGRAVLSFADFTLTGTALRYFRRNWPYALFFCYPFAVLALLAAIAAAAAIFLGGWGGVLAGVVIFAGLYLGPGRYLRVPQALDDWDFARNFVHGRRPETQARVAAFADTLGAAVRSGDAPEIILVGHSFGATLALEVLARALDRDSQLSAQGPAVRLLTVGATIPKLGLHPRGGAVRTAATRVAAAPGLEWAEYQACDDPISFYKVDPLSLERRRDYPPDSRPMVRRVHVREMLAPATYHRFRHRFVRLHYQSLMANDVRTRYDLFMFACGPVAFSDLVAAPGGPADFFAVDGSRHPPASSDGNIAR